MNEMNFPDSQTFHEAVVIWQKSFGRHNLPWMVPDAYLRWLSEVMLQQTQVSVVRDYFARFTAAFPTIKDLAQAPETEVMRLWAGLGYYSRARNLHRAAKMVEQDFEGCFPQTLDGLMKLPGVGRSTAAAIGSFCFDLMEPVLDGNVKRVLSRVTMLELAVDSTTGDKILLSLAQNLVKYGEPGVFNQGMMDIGALICTKTKPKCSLCPINGMCRAFFTGTQQNYPIKRTRIVRTDRLLKLALIERDEAYWLVSRLKGDIWPGLWCLPEATGVKNQEPIMRIKRVLTHLNLTIEVYRLREELKNEKGFWVNKDEVVSRAKTLPLPVPIRLILEQISKTDHLF